MKRWFHHLRGARGCALGVGLLVGLAAPAAAQQGKGAVGPGSPEAAPVGRLSFPVAEAAAAIDVDGRLDEAVWAQALTVPLPWETAPGDNEPAAVDTRCGVAFDESRLYVGCEALDPEPDRIRAFITDRDDLDGQDRITLSLDPFNDGRRAFEFTISALGVQGDAVFDEQTGMADDSWDAIWHSSGRVTDEGYTVEAAIPFRSLRFPATDRPQTWGFHARREWPRSTRVELRSMAWDRSDACQLCQANLLTGIRGVSPGLNVQATPTLTTKRHDVRATLPDGSFDNGPISAEPGLDLRWGVTSDLSLNATANPDFSQVEADAPQLDANNRFALFFPEKRPFFLEGADFFQTPLRAVFTRTVADPIGGAKLTGKLGAFAGGAMVTVDRVNNLLLPGSEGSGSASLDDEVVGAVARVRRDVGASGTLGALYTGRVGTDYSNHVAGVDAFLRPLGALSLRTQVLYTATRYPEAVAEANGQPVSPSGPGARFEARYETRSWRMIASGRALDAGFRADAGFLPQVGVRGGDIMIGRQFWPRDAFLSRVAFFGGGWHNETTDGALLAQGVWTSFEFGGPWQSDLWLNPNLSRQGFRGEVHDLFQLWAGGSVRPTGSLSLGVDGMVGEAVDFRNARKGDQVRVSPRVGLRAGRHVDLQLSGSVQRMALNGEHVFTAVASQLRAVYNFSPRAFLRTVLQYRVTDRNPALNADLAARTSRGLASQVLFSYKVNPLTVLFVGYADDRLGEDPLGAERIPLTQTSRSFFVKLGYAWRP